MKDKSPSDSMRQHDDLNIVEGVPSNSGCCSSTPSSFDFQRREFIKVAGLGLVGAVTGSARSVMAGNFSSDDLKHGLLIPADKKLDEHWVRSLFERGTKEVYRGGCLQNIGMPCGGIGTGQLYLRGDGTLGVWQIFNNGKAGWGNAAHTIYRDLTFDSPVKQGFAVTVRRGNGPAAMHALSAEGFSDVAFQGEYPIGNVRYADDAVPVAVEMEAFSPFIPLNAKDSALPATLFHLTLRNTTSRKVRTSVLGWLENVVCRSVGDSSLGEKTTAIIEKQGCRMVLHSAAPKKPSRAHPERPPVVFEDFEAEGFTNWQIDGEAFGDKPSTGANPSQGGITGFDGKRFVNSFTPNDQTKGRMVSKPFTIDRPFINMLVGGGGHRGQTCVNLVVDDNVVRSATGDFTEHLSWKTWDVTELAGKQARIIFVDQSDAGWGHLLVDHIEFADSRRSGDDNRFVGLHDFGTMALACSEPASRPLADPSALSKIPKNALVGRGSKTSLLEEELSGFVQSREFDLKPGEQRTITFALAWHFPNANHGNFYATRFSSAAEVVDYLFEEHDRLAGETRRWRDVYYDSTLPYWLLDRLMSTASTLASGTCQWWANGRFYAYEGVLCCPGTCTHVWNYAQAHARLFPELSRSIRELQDFNPRANGGGYHVDSGLVGFRSNDAYAADGQCGTILKAYRDHQTSPDSSFLLRFWPRIKQALLYSIEQDSNSDGLIENSQHNTYDINYEGPNTFVGSLYLAALRAGEEMAVEVGDLPFARHCRAIYESGLRLTQERLWNGEYFVQDVDLDEHPRNQYGLGCLSDQVFGQGWAHQVDLGYIYPREKVASALRAVWKYNWAPDIGPYNEAHTPFRWFITPGRAGLFTCTWPRSEYLPDGTSYKNEVWSGIEYQVAGHMVAENMVTEGLAICRAIHDRYQPELFNPYNEIECGDHYARALASWGVFLNLSGYTYHGPLGKLGFAPKIHPENFKSAFTASEGWGTFEQHRDGQQQEARISVKWGKLRLRELSFALDEGNNQCTAELTMDGDSIPAQLHLHGKTAQLALAEPLVLHQGSTLHIRFSR